jgi:hypothetical protein
MHGINALTGKPLTGIEHLRQSIRDILTTRIGTRVMRRDYGSDVPRLVDAAMTPRLAMNLYMAVAVALDKWDPIPEDGIPGRDTELLKQALCLGRRCSDAVQYRSQCGTGLTALDTGIAQLANHGGGCLDGSTGCSSDLHIAVGVELGEEPLHLLRRQVALPGTVVIELLDPITRIAAGGQELPADGGIEHCLQQQQHQIAGSRGVALLQ